MTAPNKAALPATDWFDQAKFGMFIHWGLYSIPAMGEWLMHRKKIPPEEYNKLAGQFRLPDSFSPEEWVLLAKRAGAKYVVLTTRHHDGFALFDSKESDFNSVKTAAGRDFVREYVEACRKHGLRVGLYYSIMSWQFPACHTGPLVDPKGWEEMVSNTHAQLREIMTNYGKIDLLWYDGCVTFGIGDPLSHQRFWRTTELNAMVRSLQPGILINDRAALSEDFATPEQRVAPPPAPRRWEACMTINSNWGYNHADKEFKSVEELLRSLVHCASHGGNLLLNVGPRADGSVQPEAVERLHAMGDWLAVNGEAVYGTRRTAFSEASHLIGPASTNGNRAYFFLFDWRGGNGRIAGINSRGVTASLLGDGSNVAATPNGSIIELSGLARHGKTTQYPPVLKVVIEDGSPSASPALILGGDQHMSAHDSDAPILCETPDHFTPDSAPIESGSAIAKRLLPGCDAILVQRSKWIEGWKGSQVLSSASSDAIMFEFHTPSDGSFDIEIGVVSEAAGKMKMLIDGKPTTDKTESRFPYYPDTLTLKGVSLGKGSHTLWMAAARLAKFGVYALRISPVWQKLPSELWDVIGPFPTGHDEKDESIKADMSAVYPPEREFDPTAVYTEIDGRELSWTWSPERVGNHIDAGVNFPFRCDMESGMSYARTILESPVERELPILIGCDWWSDAFINGEKIISSRDPKLSDADGAQFSRWKPLPAIMKLQAGKNALLVKCRRGSTMHWFTCRVNNPGDIVARPSGAMSR